MERGVDFLRVQVSNAVESHRIFVKALEDHEQQAKDERYREFCLRSIPRALEHQRLLEDYERAIGSTEGFVRRAAGLAMGVARDLADVVREDDYSRLVGDVTLGRQLEDTFKTFRESGRSLGLQQLARIGEVGERHHDDYVKEGNRLVQTLFTERVQGSEKSIRAAEQPITGA